MTEVFVLDTSAWIALDEKEPGAEAVESILANAWLGQATSPPEPGKTAKSWRLKGQ